ncbi:MAG: maleylacetoacetate isomerase [Alphaproteobacteria bacterium]
MAETKLFDYWRSSASYRVRIALNLAGVGYERIDIDLRAGDQITSAHLARNPQALVPVLEIDGQRFTQSLAIIDYLDRTRALGLSPDNPTARAHVWALAQSIAIDLHPICNLRVATHVGELMGAVEGVQADWMHHFMVPALAAFEALLGRFEQTPYCAGDAPSIADLCLIPQLYNAERWQVNTSGFARISAVAAACAAHAAFADAHPDRVKPD